MTVGLTMISKRNSRVSNANSLNSSNIENVCVIMLRTKGNLAKIQILTIFVVKDAISYNRNETEMSIDAPTQQ